MKRGTSRSLDPVAAMDRLDEELALSQSYATTPENSSMCCLSNSAETCTCGTFSGCPGPTKTLSAALCCSVPPL